MSYAHFLPALVAGLALPATAFPQSRGGAGTTAMSPMTTVVNPGLNPFPATTMLGNASNSVMATSQQMTNQKLLALIEAEIQLVLVPSAAVLVLVIERRRDDRHHLGSRETRCVTSGTGIRGRLLYPLKDKLKRIVAMLPRLAMRSDRGSESSAWYDAAIDYEHEHHCAEHE